ncbi:hypothetical protein PVAP13_1NG193519 [Panicum virgatum]|uniref:Uncharacterized protein n=1 Tax=Panicum virgatum TaxID=38727 RepID=A0A8T0WVY5_PANVG|nr:hypothetical protein PVAP13_1NG193519 [Panicum virgatum]
MDPLHDTKEPGVVEDARHHKREQDRARAASTTYEQREGKSRIVILHEIATCNLL